MLLVLWRFFFAKAVFLRRKFSHTYFFDSRKCLVKYKVMPSFNYLFLFQVRSNPHAFKYKFSANFPKFSSKPDGTMPSGILFREYEIARAWRRAVICANFLLHRQAIAREIIHSCG